MKHFILTAVTMVFCTFALMSKAQEAPIKEVITNQLTAFQADDFDAAFAHASPMIQGMFGSADNFGAMVRGGYPMVWRPADIRFLGLQSRAGALWQDVMIRDQEGRIHILEYEMIKDEMGWKINGVQLRPPVAGTV
ncbi:DUF4864 domain-containing protein [Pseudohalocynthiibacter aestuariivivens]|nr:DUF4864 domain-containing protein [Pseudohalocynthiibacter aestuariivivens]QIE44040.1 DUF4864 domain-containing protein [Pseudohalocynthiibacter aestuariivivens]